MFRFASHVRVIALAYRLASFRGLAPVCLLLMTVQFGATAVAQSGPALISVQHAWIRWLPGTAPAGGYFKVVNASDRSVTLVRASSPDYAKVSLHRTTTTNGVSQMLPVPAIEIPAHSALDFAALGYHLMLEQPRRKLSPGDQVPVRLSFKDSPALTVQFPLRNSLGDAPTSTTKGMADMPGMH